MSRNHRVPPDSAREEPRWPAHVAYFDRSRRPPNRPESAAVPPRRPRTVNLSLRWRVLKRDNFRCVACGRSPATELGCELHVDHIVPASKGARIASTTCAPSAPRATSAAATASDGISAR